MKNSILRFLLYLTTIVVVLELFSYLIFEYFLTERLSYHWKISPEVVISDLDQSSIIDYRSQFFDPDLGWVFHQNTTAIPYAAFDNLGARLDPENALDGMVFAYGDSFTFGEDVLPNETWPHYLSKLTGRDVKNFGVSGYGPDQALLRLRKHLEMGENPDVVVLGTLSENIARLVNVWRPAYTKGEILNFKPIFWINGNKAQLIPSPLKDIQGNDDVIKAVANAQSYDYWLQYNLLRPLPPDWPYAWSIIRTSFYLAFRVKRWEDLWAIERPTEIFGHVVSELVKLSEEYNFDPILLMIPMGKDWKLKDSNKPTTYENTITELKKAYESKLLIIDIADEVLVPMRFFQKPFSGHTSPYGNRMIAESIKRYLKED